MPWDDLEETLAELGYGEQWDETTRQLAQYKKARDVQSLDRLLEYNKRFPEKHTNAIKRWMKKKYQERKEEVKHRVGVDRCKECLKKLTKRELIWESKANPMTCYNCKREKKNV